MRLSAGLAANQGIESVIRNGGALFAYGNPRRWSREVGAILEHMKTVLYVEGLLIGFLSGIAFTYIYMVLKRKK